MNQPVEIRVREVFRELPFLLGFTVDRELCVCDIEVDTWPGCPWHEGLYSEIGGTLAEVLGAIIEDGAADQLRERTFARSVH